MPLYAAINMRFNYAKSTFSEIVRGKSVKAWYRLPCFGAFAVYAGYGGNAAPPVYRARVDVRAYAHAHAL